MIDISDNRAGRVQPTFILARPHRTVTAHGRGQRFTSAAEAAAHLRNGKADMIVGALPFAPDEPAALWTPDRVSVTGERYRPATSTTLPRFEFDDAIPTPDEHLRRVATAVRLLRDEANPVRKVVLARAIRARAEHPIEAVELLDQLVSTDPAGNGFLVDLSAAGGLYHGKHLVGASPEMLINREGSVVASHPLAGSASRRTDPDADRVAAEALLGSAKDLQEHQYVVDQVEDLLRKVCGNADVSGPSLTATPNMWHLGTAITAAVVGTGPSALELAATLHPTPAVCGTPTTQAARLIASLEGSRGFYAGAVGWCDRDGNGEWMVSIRCAELSSNRQDLVTYAGGGIVAESDPHAELAETTAKFARVLKPLGLTNAPATVI
ncbi:isochorismate synthase [Nocardia sp. IBHARD005]|uniref:isochorismate synthase n=1 Tax=Nocardia sp. IBHARD005 TaxID=3457765 RepID=UPI004059D392